MIGSDSSYLGMQCRFSPSGATHEGGSATSELPVRRRADGVRSGGMDLTESAEMHVHSTVVLHGRHEGVRVY